MSVLSDLRLPVGDRYTYSYMIYSILQTYKTKYELIS